MPVWSHRQVAANHAGALQIRSPGPDDVIPANPVPAKIVRVHARNAVRDPRIPVDVRDVDVIHDARAAIIAIAPAVVAIASPPAVAGLVRSQRNPTYVAVAAKADVKLSTVFKNVIEQL